MLGERNSALLPVANRRYDIQFVIESIEGLHYAGECFDAK